MRRISSATARSPAVPALRPSMVPSMSAALRFCVSFALASMRAISSSRPTMRASLRSDVVLRRIGERPRIRSTRLVALDQPADVRDQPVGIVDGRDRAVCLDGDVVPGRHDLAGKALLLVPSSARRRRRGRRRSQGPPLPHRHRQRSMPRSRATGDCRAPDGHAASRAEPVITVEQHRQDRRAEAVGPMRDERRRHDGAQLREVRGRVLDLELPVRRLVHGRTLPAPRSKRHDARA